MADPYLIPATEPIKRAPLIVGKNLTTGKRWYVYECRGGPLLFKKDGRKPTREEALMATRDFGRTRAIMPNIVPMQRPRGTLGHRPKFIGALIKHLKDCDRWTYFISDGRAVKIGAAKCVRSRLKILQAHNPTKLVVLAMVRGGEVLESAYHALFAAHRLDNEWFELVPEVIDEIARLEKATRAELNAQA